jgi:DNA helicase-2/ATP-dependent DNA helicase PcrA
MEVQMELTRHGIPFQITSGLRFFEQAHIKDVAAFLKYVVNPRDEVAFKRMVRLLPGIGARSAEQLWNEASRAVEGLSSSGRPASFRELLLPLKVSAKSRKAWEQLAHTLEEIAPGG